MQGKQRDAGQLPFFDVTIFPLVLYNFKLQRRKRQKKKLNNENDKKLKIQVVWLNYLWSNPNLYPSTFT